MELPLFLRKLAAPVEVKRVLEALDEEKHRMSEAFPLGPPLGFDVVKPTVVERILMGSAAIKKLVSNGKPPRGIALWTMMSVSRDGLCLGFYHLFHGRLSMPGNGVHGGCPA